jgi:rSAM/selenodomain-associated transferase 2
LADRTLVAPRGRAAQMNAGAGIACGDTLLFLHADSTLEPAAVAMMLGELVATGRRWGRFDVAIDGQARLLRLVAALMNLRSRLTGIATGDHGIFVERALFDRIGGYPALPLMEDIALSKALKRAAGTPLCLSARIVTSGRRWEKHGAWRTILRMWWLRLLFYCGADPARLARAYDA